MGLALSSSGVEGMVVAVFVVPQMHCPEAHLLHGAPCLAAAPFPAATHGPVGFVPASTSWQGWHRGMILVGREMPRAVWQLLGDVGEIDAPEAL